MTFPNLGNVYFVLEIMIAELIFMYAYPKRKKFLVRYIAAFVTVLTVAYLLPFPSPGMPTENSAWILILRFTSLWVLTVIAMCFCFSASISAIVSAAAAGYALQHFSYKLLTIIDLTGIFNFVTTQIVSAMFIKELILFPIPYFAAFLSFGRFSAKMHYYNKNGMRFYVLSIATIFICIVLNRFTQFVVSALGIVCVALYSMTCTLLALFIQYSLQRSCAVKEENAVIQNVLQEKEKQYETSKDSIELINIKCHDLKHTISKLSGRLPDDEIESMKAAIGAYESKLETGNDVLDVILLEKNMRCNALGIKFTCMGNGKLLGFMNAVDIYSLFGNAIDNSIEAVSGLNIYDMKVIGLTIENKDDLVIISTFNYFSGRLMMIDGLPQSTKQTEKGYHGYGLKSIKLIAEKYNGGIQVSTSENIFNLCIYLKNR